jgi:hypothetical protein
MLVTTHTIVATTIAIKTGNPLIYIPAAILNHPILDALPHFGNKEVEKNPYFNIAVSVDAVLGIGFFIFFILKTNFPPLQIFMVDLLAGWPDLVLGYNRFINLNRFVKFQALHSKIQKLESLWGAVIELSIWTICFYLIFS